MTTRTSPVSIDPVHRATDENRRAARATGALFLAAFLLYGIGTTLTLDSGPGARLYLGVGLMLANSAVVVAIGILVRGVLRPQARAIGNGYLATRVAEGVLLGAGAVALLLAAPELNVLLYNLGMIVLAAGSLFFCATLHRLRLFPTFVAAWGFLGYAAFGIGCALELAGVTDAGLYGAAPGGLFEVFFALLLIIRGFERQRLVPASQRLAL